MNKGQQKTTMRMLFTPASLHGVLATLLMIVFLAPPSLGWRGVIDCAKRCHLARTTGAHCPLMYHRDSQTKPVTAHCPMHERAASLRAELHCACRSQSPTFTSDATLTYFLVSSFVELLVPPRGVLDSRGSLTRVPTRVFSPPDPPPRIPFSLLV